MSNISTFGTYTMARLGIFAAQRALDVVGNNITNINTEGYTRQSVNQISLNLGGADRYQNRLDIRVGNGALADGIVQHRDQYVDARYRDEVTSVGSADGTMTALKDLSTVLDEVGDGDEGAGVLEARFNEMVSQMEELHARGAGKDEYDAMFRTSASAVVNTINSFSVRLDNLLEKEETRFRDDLDNVNSLLVRIRDLNSSIHDVEVFGGNALEQKDQRNLLLDQLAELTRISVTEEQENLGAGVTVDRLVVRTMGIPQRTLVDGNYCTQLVIRTVEADKSTGEAIEPLSSEDVERLADYVSDNLSVDLANEIDDSKKLLASKFGAVADRHVLGNDTPSTKMRTYLATLMPDASTLDETRKAEVETRIRSMLQEVASVQTEPIEDPFYGINTTEMRDANGRTADLEVTDATPNGVMVGTGGGYRFEVAPSTGEATKYAERTAAAKIVEVLNGSANYTQETLPDGSVATYSYELAGSLADGYRIERYNEDGTHQPLIVRGKAYLPIDVEGAISATTYPDGAEAARIAKVLNAEMDYPTEVKEDGREIRTEYRAVESPSGNGYEIHRYELFQGVTHTGETELYGKLQSEREMLTKSGVFSTNQQLEKDPEAAVKRGIPYYQKTLDVLANTFATMMNKINRDAGGVNLFSNDPGKDTDGTSGEDGDAVITAANISISKTWYNGALRTTVRNSADESWSTGNDNLVLFLNALTGNHDFYPQGGFIDADGNEVGGGINTRAEYTDKFFVGSFQALFTNHMAGTLANDSRATQAMLDNYNATKEDLYVERDSIMGVDLNDEAANMMMYQKSYAAACRLMTVFDNMLDRLINGTAL